jgi:hypothetical protein
MEMLQNILQTYNCLISARENLPGAKLEDVFSSDIALPEFKKEREWIKKQLISPRVLTSESIAGSTDSAPGLLIYQLPIS